MKKLFILLLVFLPLFSVAQTKEKKNDDVIITINVTKINKTVGGIVGFIKSEAKQFKQETEENLSEEHKQTFRDIKERIKYELKYTHDAIHAGYSQGLRGEEYTPPYEHKYNPKYTNPNK